MIFVDSREKVCNIPNLLEKYGLPVTYVTLDVGDYVIENIAVERKEIGDYISSKTSGHLDKQLYQLSSNFSLSYLVVTGMPEEELANRQMSRFTYISSLVGSSLKRSPDGKCGQVITVNLTTDYDAALFLKALHDKISTGDLVRLPKMEKANFSQEDRAEFILASFPKIGEVRAKQLLRQYGSLFETLNVLATLNVQVKGVGVEGVKNIKEILNHKYEE